jgi:hypothetical protein
MTETLDGVLADSLACLARGAADPGSAWRNPTLLTIGADGTPQARTVVLRGFDPALRRLEIHTDTRSAKHAELLANATCGLHGWDHVAGIQLRLTGRASLHAGDPVADAAWAGLRPRTRQTYRVRPGPGAGRGGRARRLLCPPPGVRPAGPAASQAGQPSKGAVHLGAGIHTGYVAGSLTDHPGCRPHATRPPTR